MWLESVFLIHRVLMAQAMIPKSNAMESSMNSSERKKAIPCLLLIALPLPATMLPVTPTCPSTERLAHEDFLSFGQKGSLPSTARPTSAKGKPGKWEQRLLSWSSAIARDGLCAQLLPVRTSQVPVMP